jgi:ABC-type multidrug transport system ATPase subunit
MASISSYESIEIDDTNLLNTPLVGSCDSLSSMVSNKAICKITAQPATVKWNDVCYQVETKKGIKKILQSINGSAKPGELVAILGASGAGKTTLLNSLTGRIDATSGKITLNGYPMNSDFNDRVAFCQQEDLFLGTLTVKEHLMYQARLRMAASTTKQEREARVEEVMNVLGLKKVENSRIGTKFQRGLSGGEKKRLNFASEIITNPSVLYCDEPTSGLDSFMAEGVVRQLRNLAAEGKTIICTIHQPSNEVFALFDKVLLLAPEGRAAYFGIQDKVVSYFSKQGLTCPTYTNPADYVIRNLSIDTRQGPDEEAKSRDHVNHLVEAWKKTETDAKMMSAYSLMDDSIAEESGISDGANKDMYGVASLASPAAGTDEGSFGGSMQKIERINWFLQLAVLVSRCSVTLSRDFTLTFARLGQAVVLALACGAIYWQIAADVSSSSAIMSTAGALFFVITNQGFSGLFSVLQAFPAELPIFNREYQAGCYRVDSYFLAKTIAELPYQIIFPVIFCSVVYPMVGFEADWEKFFLFVLIISLVANTAMSCGYMVSTATPSVQVALAVGPIFILPVMLFGGLFLNSEQVPSYLQWLSIFSFFKYAFEMTGIIVFEDHDNWHFIKGFYSWDETNFRHDLYALVSLLVGFRLLSFIFLLIRARLSLKKQ